MSDSSDSSKSSRGRKRVVWAWAAAGFVILIIVALFAFQPDERPHIVSKEAVLKIDLMTMRNAIDNYTLDKQKAPQSLQDLVDAHYLRSIPIDPMTTQRDWQADFDDVTLSPSSLVHGLVDIRSASKRTSLSGTPYSEW